MLRRRVRYLWSEMDPAGIELLSAALSLTFGVLLLYRGNAVSTIDYAYWYAALCLLSGGCKVIGVLWERTLVRIAGLLLGTVFWITLSFVLATVPRNGITWLAFAILALAQLWAVRRIVKGR